MIPVLIYTVLPLLGVMGYVRLMSRMRDEKVPSPPVFTLLVLFAVFGGWLVVLLTNLLWKWSGMASVGVLVLVVLAPFVTGVLALRLRNRRALSPYHKAAFAAGMSYSIVVFSMVGAWVLLRGGWR
jgi:hypothetical protein